MCLIDNASKANSDCGSFKRTLHYLEKVHTSGSALICSPYERQWPFLLQLQQHAVWEAKQDAAWIVKQACSVLQVDVPELLMHEAAHQVHP